MTVADEQLIEGARTVAENIDQFRELCIMRDGSDVAVAYLYEAATSAWEAFAALGGEEP